MKVFFDKSKLTLQKLVEYLEISPSNFTDISEVAVLPSINNSLKFLEKCKYLFEA